MKVFVYWNLHRGCWSLRALAGRYAGRVVAHTEALTLRDARFRVSEPGRQRVLRDRVKNVHAGVVGYVHDQDLCAGQARVRYNPYQGPTFVTALTGAPVHSAPLATLTADGKVYVNGVETL